MAELTLAALASLIFLGCLGTVELWGKREQRAAAETLDTVRNGHWLVAQIQCRPRLEKPPLPRWTIAALIMCTGRDDEWIIRLPNALAALATVGLVTSLGRRMAGRATGLAAGCILTSLVFFVSEMRQAGNDAPLAFFTTLGLYAASRRLHGGQNEGWTSPPGDQLGSRGWVMLLHAALGLGFLCKGPIVLLLAGLTVVPYLAVARRVRSGLRALWDVPSLSLLIILALSWPVPVLISDRHALAVWLLEMGQKTVAAGVSQHQPREVLILAWFWMTLPWSALAALAAIQPLLRRGRDVPRPIWFAWSWAVINLGMFCVWRIAKPNYYLPCLPGLSLLVGIRWVDLVRRARGADRLAFRARVLLRAHWVAFVVAVVVLAIIFRKSMPFPAVCMGILVGVTIVAVMTSAQLWRRGADAVPLLPLVGSLAVGIPLLYGVIAPTENAVRSHHELARTLDRLLPDETRTVMFFHELDEGLWFYLRDRQLVPVPGSAPRYNDSFDLLQDYRHDQTLSLDPPYRLSRQKEALIGWLDQPHRAWDYVLVLGKTYDHFAPDLEGKATLIYREHHIKRNDLVLLRPVGWSLETASDRDRPDPSLR